MHQPCEDVPSGPQASAVVTAACPSPPSLSNATCLATLFSRDVPLRKGDRAQVGGAAGASSLPLPAFGDCPPSCESLSARSLAFF